ncbi:unnamed protein product [Pneumocystis jirovecii]|uniref:Uncharacterized protein n=1 Tax=Pneumocystis jirovecii TaxID=42068 RepID=L0PC33_PNEJI|nr:unnamed protein product [Pneumocystis jirovecii]
MVLAERVRILCTFFICICSSLLIDPSTFNDENSAANAVTFLGDTCIGMFLIDKVDETFGASVITTSMCSFFPFCIRILSSVSSESDAIIRRRTGEPFVAVRRTISVEKELYLCSIFLLYDPFRLYLLHSEYIYS